MPVEFLNETPLGSASYSESEKFFKDYFDFLEFSKTDRERVSWTKNLLNKNNIEYREFSIGLDFDKTFKPGDVFVYTNQGKNAAVGIIGSENPLKSCFHCVGSHLDTPHLDLMQNSVVDFSDNGLAALKTHYYGGIKLFQFANIPLVLKGHCRDASGKYINVSIGDKPEDPVFTIPDILIHLTGTDRTRTMMDVMKPSEMSAICMGSRTEKTEEDKDVDKKENDDKKQYNNFRKSFLDLLNQKYNLNENSLIYGEWSLFPAHKPRWVGYDKTFIGGHGQDDGSCAYASAEAFVDFVNKYKNNEVELPKHTAVIFMYSYEETGSVGAAGSRSSWTRDVLGDIALRYKDDSIADKYFSSALAGALQRTFYLSADVTAAYDHNFMSKHDSTNVCVAGKGVGVCRYTGHGGKSSSSEASTETMARFIDLVNGKTQTQMCMLGAVGVGGGGTIAAYIADNLNCNIIDCGVGVFAMHTPFELIHKEDLWSAKVCYEQVLSRD